MYAHIAPALALPRGLHTFTYRIPPGLEVTVGSFVRINFNARQTVGIVTEMSEQSDIPDAKLRAVGGVIDVACFRAEEVRALKTLALEMQTGMPRLLHYLVPAIPARWPIARETFASLLKKRFEQEVVWSLDQEAVRVKMLGKIKTCLRSYTQVMIVVGRKRESTQLLNFFRENLHGSKIAFFDQALPLGARYAAWRSLRDGAEVLITTRAGSFAPAKNLGLIIVYHEDSEDFKDWGRDPYLDARVVAEYRARALQIPLVVTTTALRVPTYQKIQTGETHFARLMTEKHIRPRIIDMGKIKDPKNANPITKPLHEAIAHTLQTNTHVVLLTNRKGDGGVLRCGDCGKTSTCRRCGGYLVPHGPHLECHRCEHQSPVPLFCANCKGPHLRSFGWGVDHLKKFLREMYPNVQVVAIQKERGSPVPSLIHKKPCIFVGTTKLFSYGLPDQIGLLAIPQADQFLLANDFRSEERAYLLFREFQALGGAKTSFILQTLSPEHRVFKALASSDDSALYNEWLAERKKWHYPPFARLYALTFRAKGGMLHQTVMDKIARVKERLGEHIELGEPVAWPYAIRGVQRWTVLIKIPLEASVPKNLPKLFPHWNIDADPQQLFTT